MLTALRCDWLEGAPPARDPLTGGAVVVPSR
jgi:hypothetical protein